jgi:UDP-2,4-diacetamido-2,4,6-trideoxy-beta-L-altropyranose hydrolase
MSFRPRILFATDAGAEVGGGHVMRSLTLARALGERGAACAFLLGPGVEPVLSAFAPDMPRVPVENVDTDTLMETTGPDAFDALAFDHYGLGAEDHRDVARGRPTLVIDDLANRPLSADVVVDSGPQRRSEDYQGLIPPEARLLLGPAFAPVRPEFAALRGQALGRRGGPVDRILISLGLTDVGGFTGKVLDRLRTRIGSVALDVAIGSAAPSRAGLERLARHDSRLTVHVDTPEMARLTAEADLAIGAAGSSAWERCVLALPSVMLILADNQRPAAQALNELGAASAIEASDAAFDQTFDRAFLRLYADAAARTRMAGKAAEICDGLGAARTADTFLEVIAARDSAPRPQPI